MAYVAEEKNVLSNLGVDELRCLPKVDSYRSKLEKRHDELADLKSYFDGHMKTADGEEQFDKQNLVLNWVIHRYSFCRGHSVISPTPH